MDTTGLPTRTELDEGSKSPLSRLRHKRPLSCILPSVASSSSRTSPTAAEQRTNDVTREKTSVMNLSLSAAANPAAAAAAATGAPAAAAAATNSSSSFSAPWDLSLSEGLDFCRDGDALLRQLHQRIDEMGQQLAAAAAIPASGVRSEANEDGTRNVQSSSGEDKGEDKLVEHQQLLKDEIDDCIHQIQELRRLLLSAISLIKSNPILKDTAMEADGGPRGEAVMKAVKLFRLDSTAERYAEPLASSLVGVLSGIRRFMSVLAGRIHALENSAAVWLTHGGEILPYLKHLQNSFKELQQQEEETAEKAEEVKERIKLKMTEKESVKFCLEKTKDEFRQARLDLTREELEKIPAKERLQLLETKRETLDRELRSLAAFSPLFIVERAAKYITLQYRPPNDRVRRLLESGIGELLQKLSAKQTAAHHQTREEARGRQAAEGSVEAAGDKVVEYIAAILIKTLSSSFTTPNTPPRFLSLIRGSPSAEAIQTN